MVAVLHLSDLHRSLDDPIRNDQLLAALQSDQRRWPADLATAPDLVVISGDVVQGVRVGYPGHEPELERQYEEAGRFLIDVAERFLAGDRSRMIIVPGNHDVDWNAARQAMEATDAATEGITASLPEITLRPGSGYRWSWAEQTLFKVADTGAYRRRLTRFMEFRERFYSGVSPNPLAIDPDLFFMEYPEFDLSITGLSSWFGNDCYCLVGAFDPQVLARTRDLIAESSCTLHLAVWHHSISGTPQQSDFLDVAAIRQLVDYGYRVGLHGHHHRTATAVTTLKLPTTEEMALISAGSLCVGPRQLPTGVNRQYNILDVRPAERKVRVFVREAIGELIFAAGARSEFGGSDSVTLQWTATPPRHHLQQHTADLDQAFTAYAEGDVAGAAAILSRVDARQGPARALRVEVLGKLGQLEELADFLGDPTNPDELMVLVDVLCRLGAPQRAREVMATHADRLGISRDIKAQADARISVAEVAR